MDFFLFSSLLIGAPRDHSPHDIIGRRGTVWKCEFYGENNCERMPFRRNGKQKIYQMIFSVEFLSIFLGEANVRVGTSYDNKTDQWLGASLAANDAHIIVGFCWISKLNSHI